MRLAVVPLLRWTLPLALVGCTALLTFAFL